MKITYLLVIILITYSKSQDYTIAEIYKNDKRGNKAVEKLLKDEGIKKDQNLDYTCGVFNEEYNIIATGSCFGNTIRCVAVNRNHQV